VAAVAAVAVAEGIWITTIRLTPEMPSKISTHKEAESAAADLTGQCHEMNHFFEGVKIKSVLFV
jgi:hypothetical protein